MIGTARRRRFNYGWLILAASFLIALLTTGVQTSFGVFLKPLQDDFGWTRAAISLVPSLNLLVTCLFFPVAGWIADTYGPKAIVALGGFSAGLGMVLVSRISAPWQLYVYYSLMVGVGVGCASTPITATVTRWFEKRRGLALGIAQSGTAVGTITLAPLAGYLLSAYGWRTSFLVIGLATGVVVIAAFCLRKQPSVGALTNDQAADIGTEKAASVETGLTLTEAVRTKAFWLLFLVYVLSYGTLMMVLYNVVAHAEDAGISEATAASFLSAVGGGNIIGFIAGGMASDRLGRKPVMVFSLVLQSALMILLIKASSIWMFYAFSALWGVITGGWAPLMPTIAGELFGLRRIGSIVGAVSMTYGIGGAIGLVFAGSIFTATGSYTVAFVVGAVALLSSAVIVPLLKPPKARQSDSRGFPIDRS
ncbi:MAG: MFS transporter [Chloroflexi bacterium]|nr:MFS transporter [Chloroflexota bacterium]